ncbi:SAVED domain-containing protein [Sorangium sp. So ce118]
MSDPSRLLVVSHPVLALIGCDEIEDAISDSDRTSGWDHIEIAPMRIQLGNSHEIDWAAALTAQERLFTERLRDEITSRKRLAYFGFAPIPLALHLGYRVERCIRVDVYQRHHFRRDWAWSLDEPAVARPLLSPRTSLPEHGSKDAGPVVIRVSTSHPIAQADTAEVVPCSLAEVDVILTDPSEDALHTKGAVTEVVTAFSHALLRVKRLFPNVTAIHLFAAVPVSLAFQLGTQINPTIYQEVVTYQYWAKGSPRYRQAIVLAEQCRAGLSQMDTITTSISELDSGAGNGAREVTRLDRASALSNDLDHVCTPESIRHFLNEAGYDWSSREACQLYQLMVHAYGSMPRAEEILTKSGIDRANINFNQTTRDVWREAFDVAARANLIHELAQNARNDNSIRRHHPTLDALILFHRTGRPNT